MNISIGIKEGLREITSHKFRSFLTMFGVILGVASLMSMFALTAGTIAGSRAVLTEVGGLERIDVVSVPVPTHQAEIADQSPGRTYLDALALRRNVPLLKHISPEIEIPARVTRSNKATNPWTHGVEPDFLEVYRHEMDLGRFINKVDVQKGHRVCVIGRSIVQDLWEFPNVDPVGEIIQVNGVSFQIIGVFKEYSIDSLIKSRDSLKDKNRQKNRGASARRHGDPFWWKNRAMVMPITTAQTWFKGARLENGIDIGPDPKLSRLAVQVRDIKSFNETLQQMRNVLLMTHRGIRDFGFQTQEDWFAQIESQNRTMKLTGGVIAGISLLVGGLGIANTMLASISERVREIGIRRAIGAKASDIFVQILIESLLLAVIGGVLGLVAGWGLSQGLILLAPSQSNPIIESDAIMISIGFAGTVGLLAGLYPALRASSLSPIQALRYE